MWFAVVFWQEAYGREKAELAMVWDGRAKGILYSSLQRRGYVVRDQHVANISEAENFHERVQKGIIR